MQGAQTRCPCVTRLGDACACELAAVLAPRHLAIRRLFDTVGTLAIQIPSRGSANDAVLRSVIGQMLSTQAARAIRRRVLGKWPSSVQVFRWACRTAATPGPLLGLSQRKRKALAAWWRYSRRRPSVRTAWARLPTAEFRAEICSIHGLGPWTADMLGIFLLGRPDIWPSTDAGVRRASMVVFAGVGKAKLPQIIRGYESVVALYLWEVLNRRLLEHF